MGGKSPLRRSSVSALSGSAARQARDAAGFTLAEMLVVVAVTGFLMAAVFAIYEVTQRTTFRASGSEAALVQARAVVDKFGGDFRMVGAAWNFFASPITAATASSITLNGDIDNTLDASYNPVVLTAAVTAVNTTTVTVSDTTNISSSCNQWIALANGPIAERHQLLATNCTSTTSGAGTASFQTSASDSGTFTTYPASAVGSGDVTFVYTVETVNWVWDSTSQKLCRKVNAVCPADPTTWDDNTDVIADNVTNFCLTYLDYTGNVMSVNNVSCGTVSGALSSIRAAIVTVTVKSQVGDQTISRQMELTARARTLIP
jgi:prepilin-type N-terminal cleavage/methylation domain-containing protein